MNKFVLLSVVLVLFFLSGCTFLRNEKNTQVRTVIPCEEWVVNK